MIPLGVIAHAEVPSGGGGSTYYFDPSDYTIGDDPTTDGPAQWSEGNTTSGFSTNEIANDSDGDHWHLEGASDAVRQVTLSEAGSSATEVDILCHVKGAGFRPSGGPIAFSDQEAPNGLVSLDCYFANHGGSAQAGNHRVVEYVNGSPTVLADDAGSSENALHWQRMHVDGTDVKSKVWTGAEGDEPGTWDIDTADSTRTSGWIGYAFDRRESLIYWYSVGTGGTDAPFPSEV